MRIVAFLTDAPLVQIDLAPITECDAEGAMLRAARKDVSHKYRKAECDLTGKLGSAPSPAPEEASADGAPDRCGGRPGQAEWGAAVPPSAES